MGIFPWRRQRPWRWAASLAAYCWAWAVESVNGGGAGAGAGADPPEPDEEPFLPEPLPPAFFPPVGARLAEFELPPDPGPSVPEGAELDSPRNSRTTA